MNSVSMYLLSPLEVAFHQVHCPVDLIVKMWHWGYWVGSLAAAVELQFQKTLTQLPRSGDLDLLLVS